MIPAEQTARSGVCDRAAKGLLRISFACAFLSLALVSFDIFPYRLAGGFHPQLPYMISLAGALCYLASLEWRRHWRRHRTLLLIVGAFLLYGLVSTLLNASLRYERNLAVFSLLNYLERQAGAMAFMLWLAFLFSSLSDRGARRFFIAALMAMFLSNAVHMILELLANHGATGIKSFLIDINHWFRLEKVYWGNWPPPYYEDRVRGLFGEPAHLAYAFIPLLAFFLYRSRGSMVYIIPLLLVLVSYGGVTPTGTGILGAGFLVLAFVVHRLREKLPGRGAALAAGLALAAVLAVGGTLFSLRDRLPDYAAQWRTVDAIADYCRQAQADPALPPPELETRHFSRFIFRAVSTRLEWDLAWQHPFGVGYQLSGMYRKPLAAFARKDVAEMLRVRHALARDGDVPVFPYFCEYTAIAAEQGIIGLLLFLLLCLYIGGRAYRRYTATGDVFILYMLFALPAFMFTLLSFALRTGLMFPYFLGFLYALGQFREAEDVLDPGTGKRQEPSGPADATAILPSAGA